MKKATILILLFMSAFMVGCSSTDKLDTDIYNVDGYNVNVTSFELIESLENSTSSIQYNGDAVDITFSETPKDGELFGLIYMKVEKTNDAKESFKWSNVWIEDEDGNKYYRHENDTFLTNYEMTRIKSIDLSFGTNEGVACYEIGKTAEKKGLFLVISGQDATIKIELK